MFSGRNTVHIPALKHKSKILNWGYVVARLLDVPDLPSSRTYVASYWTHLQQAMFICQLLQNFPLLQRATSFKVIPFLEKFLLRDWVKHSWWAVYVPEVAWVVTEVSLGFPHNPTAPSAQSCICALFYPNNNRPSYSASRKPNLWQGPS